MAWDDAPPTKEELAAIQPSVMSEDSAWDTAPPTKEELAAISKSVEPSAVPEAAGFLNLGGIGPRIAAGSSAAMNAITGVTGPLAGNSWDQIKQDYNNKLNEVRMDFARAHEEHPYRYGAGSLAGIGATAALAPGTLGVSPAAMTSVPGLAAQGAILGAGESKDLTDIPDVAKNVGEGAALNVVGGKAIEAAAPVIGNGLKSVAEDVGNVAGWAGNKVSSIPKRLLSAAFGPSVEAQTAYLANPEAINTAAALPQQAERLAAASDTMNSQIKTVSNAAGSTLKGKPPLSKQAAIDALTQKAEGLKVGGSLVSKADEQAHGVYQDIIERLKQVGGADSDEISQENMKKVIQSLDQDTNWGDPGMAGSNEANVGSRVFLDQTLKNANPEYAEAMKPVAEKVRLMDYLSKKFSMRNTQNGYEVTDETANRIKQALDENRKAVTQEELGKLKEATGHDVLGEAQNYQYGQQLQGGNTQGSRKAVMGAAIGGALGKYSGVPGGWESGAALGGVLGSVADREGGAWTKGLLNASLSAKQGVQKLIPSQLSDVIKKAPQSFGKYSVPLQNAAARGATSLAATDYVLGQRDAAYNEQKKKIFEKPEDEK